MQNTAMKATSLLAAIWAFLALTLTTHAAQTPSPGILVPWTKRQFSGDPEQVVALATGPGGMLYLGGNFGSRGGGSINIGLQTLTVPVAPGGDTIGGPHGFIAAYDASGATLFTAGAFSYGGATYANVRALASARDGSAV